MLRELLSPRTTLDAFFEVHLPALHARHADRFAAFFQEPVRVEAYLEEDPAQRWYLVASGAGLEVSRWPSHQEVDVVVAFTHAGWSSMRTFLADFRSELEALVERDPPRPKAPIDRATWRRACAGGVEVRARMVDAPDDSHPSVVVRLTGSAPTPSLVQIEVDCLTVEDLLSETMTLREALAPSVLRVSGDVGVLPRMASVLAPLWPQRRGGRR